MKAILAKNPELINKPITKDSKHTLLMRAVFSASIEAVEFVLGEGADVNVITPKGETALTIAVRKNKIEIVKILLNKGADVNTENK